MCMHHLFYGMDQTGAFYFIGVFPSMFVSSVCLLHGLLTLPGPSLPPQVVSIPEPAVVLVAISPLKNFVVTCTKPMKDASGQPGNNLKVR